MTRQLLARAILPVALLWAGCGAPAGPERPAGPPVAVKTAVAQPTAVRDTFEAGGVVRARTTAVLTSRIAAPVVEVRVRAGDRVRRDQVLVVLDDRDLQAADARAVAMSAAAAQARTAAMAERDAAQSGVTLASATHGRIARLRASGSATPQELDEATAALQAAQARLRSAEARLAEAVSSVAAARAQTTSANVAATYAAITAPFAGVVADKHVEPGNMAAPGVPLVTLEDAAGFRLEVRVDESRSAGIRPGDVAVIDLGRPGDPDEGTTREGRVAEVARALEPGSHTTLVKIDLPPEAGARGGMFGRARFTAGVRQALTVPAEAVVRRGQLPAAFVVDAQGRARMRVVRTGEETDGRVEVAAGLEPDDVVILDPPPGLVDGAAVSAGASR